MENNIQISIAMCIYNGEKYIREQIDSILNQSIRDIELVIVDDGSIDNCIQIINEYIKNDSRIRLFRNKENLGYLKNFERAISLCEGNYIALSDQDDIWELNKLEILLNNIRNENSLIIYSNALLMDNNQKVIHKTLLDRTIPINNNNNLYFIFNNSISGNTILFKKELISIAFPFPQNIDFHDLWLGFVASSYFKVIYLEDCLVKYRQHENNVTNINKLKVKKTYKEKIDLKIQSIKKICYKLENYIDFLCKNIPEHDNLLIMKNLLMEYNQYDKYYFNLKLFKIIYKNKDKLFFGQKKTRFYNLIKMSIGIKLFKLLPFI